MALLLSIGVCSSVVSEAGKVPQVWLSLGQGCAAARRAERCPPARGSSAGATQDRAGAAGIRLSALISPATALLMPRGEQGLCQLPRTLRVGKASLAELPLGAEPGRAEHKAPQHGAPERTEQLPGISAGLRLALAGLSALA